MPRKILPAIRRLAPGPEEKEEEREKKMERMVKLADVLAIINAGMFDLRSSHDNFALQEAIRSLPTEVEEEKRPRLIDANEILKSEHQHYAPMADEYYVPVFDIENAPTVDAVPVEWINEWVNNYCNQFEEKLIERLLWTWSKNGRGGEG